MFFSNPAPGGSVLSEKGENRRSQRLNQREKLRAQRVAARAAEELANCYVKR